MRSFCLLFSALAILAGGVGMAMSFLYLGSKGLENIIAGAAGFVAGAILIGAGLISLAILSPKDPEELRD
jgi:hypothetical protein